MRHFVKNYYYLPEEEGKAAMIEAFDNWKKVYNCSLVMTYGASLPKRQGFWRELTDRCCGSFVCWVCVPDVLYPIGLDGRRSTVEAHPWWGTFILTPNLVHPTQWSADIRSFLQLLIALHIWAARESYEVLGIFGMWLLSVPST